MSKHSYNKIWIHFIWETLDKQKILPKPARLQLSDFLYSYCKEKKIFMKTNFVNADHVHTLIDFPTNILVEECIKLLKGSSSHYINKNRVIFLGKRIWSIFGFSISVRKCCGIY